ncbi:glycosyltransferase family 2 protein [Microvirga lenta]|uniref:glycosyltransferase family 2 protein n=1 Tax=Microvirga lenta TaxID=2881337 RepID=UPI001CFFFFB1|nr:glycosyltransferase family 2 protein [Microvirga lenta]MCB5175188.1 glycosyltransferase family 2 protein [Microvirga lenta]
MPDVKIMIELSIVVPIYRCKASLRELHRRLTAVLPSIVTSYEIVFVDDACPEKSWLEITALAKEDPHVVGVRLTRNFGQHLAITAGLKEARGNHVVVMDGDLQDPPEAIPALWEVGTRGVPIVYARRRSRHQSATRMSAGQLYFKFLRYISKWNIDPSYGTFTLLNRRVVDAYLEFSEPHRHYLFILYWLGFEGRAVDIERDTRKAGTSSYRLSSLLRHAFQGVLFFSNSMFMPIAWAITAMLLISFGAMIFSLFDLSITVTGQKILTFGAGMFGALVSGVFFIMGLYLAALFVVLKRRPLFIVAERVGQPESST